MTDTEEEILRMADTYSGERSGVMVAGAAVECILRKTGPGPAARMEKKKNYMEAADIIIAAIRKMEQKENGEDKSWFCPECGKERSI